MNLSVPRPHTSQLLTGIALVAVGVIFLGQRLEWGPLWDFARLWPAILIVLGAAECVLTAGRRGYLLIVTGTLALLDRAGTFALKDSWPLVIVAVGVTLVLNRRGVSSRPGGRNAH